MSNENNNCTNCQKFVPMDGKVNAKNGLCTFWQTPVTDKMMCQKFKKKGE